MPNTRTTYSTTHMITDCVVKPVQNTPSAARWNRTKGMTVGRMLSSAGAEMALACMIAKLPSEPVKMGAIIHLSIHLSIQVYNNSVTHAAALGAPTPGVRNAAYRRRQDRFRR